jgi:hypothetical protein
MKNLKISIILSLLITQYSIAQKIDVRGYGGLSVIQISTDNTSNLIDDIIYKRSVNGRPGFQTGIAITVGERFYLQPGIQWSHLSKEIIHINAINQETFLDKISIRSISVPLKVGMRLLSSKSTNLVNLRVFGGLDGLHVQEVKHKIKSGLSGAFDAESYSNLIMNADLGMGVDFLFMFADVGYQIGLTPVFNGTDKSKATAFYTNFGLRLKF